MFRGPLFILTQNAFPLRINLPPPSVHWVQRDERCSRRAVSCEEAPENDVTHGEQRCRVKAVPNSEGII